MTRDHLPSLMMTHFGFLHLPKKLQHVSKPFHDLAQQIVDRSLDAVDILAKEQTLRALEKLLEAKDCAVRAAL